MPTSFTTVTDGQVSAASQINQFGAPINALETLLGSLSATELGYLVGVTSAIQAQLNGKAASSHTHPISQISDWPSGLTATELGYVDGVTSAIQTQLNAKAASSHTHTISQLSDWPAGLTVTELGYVDGVTSAIQTQLNGKAANPTGTPNGSKFYRDDGTWAVPSGGASWKGCVVAKTGGLYNVPATTLTTVGWDYDLIADAALHSTSTNNSRLIADSDGVWELTFVCYAMDSSATLETRVYENGGANYSYNNRMNGPGNSAFTCYLQMSASQYVEIKQYASGSINVYSGGGALASSNNNYTRATWRKVA